MNYHANACNPSMPRLSFAVNRVAWAVLLAGTGAMATPTEPPPELAITTANRGPNAYAQAIAPLTSDQRADFFRGRQLVRQSWVIPPSEDRSISGLGPLYNQIACIACHPGNGRGFAPHSPEEPMRAMLVRLSVPGKTAHGAPLPVPAYGNQFNEFGVPGVPGDGRAELRYHLRSVTLSGPEVVLLRQPSVRFVDLAYGDLPAQTQTSARIGQALYGLGLLSAIPDATLIALSKARKPTGIHGRLNRVWEITLGNPTQPGRTVIGRFGWKANMPTLRQQIAGAFLGDMGITSSLFPIENCTAIQTACQQAPSAGTPTDPELSDAALSQVEFYHLALAAPEPRQATNADELASVQRGAQLFSQAQCAACHIPTLRTGTFPRLPVLAQQTIHPFTDLLLHDMGEGLADHRSDFLANGREWRTAPLWGIGLAQTVESQAGYLHDGRARTLQEAILWHGGEATIARQRYVRLPKEARQALLAFLQSL